MKIKLLACTVLVACGGQFSFAQTESDSTETETKRLTTVTVNAQRREQSLLDVPKAITSMSPAVLEAKQIDNILDITVTDPSVSGVSGTLSSPLHNTPIRIRGIGTGGGNPGFEGAVGFYVDEVYRSRAGAAMLGFFDMAGVDILRGPQGTLFGKNTTSGAIVQRTQAPIIGENSGFLSASYANYNTVNLEGAANFIVGEDSAIRLSGMHNTTDGFFEYPNISGDPRSGEDTAGSETTAFRAQFASDISDSLSVRLVADYSNFKTNAQYGQSVNIDGPNAQFSGLPFALPDPFDRIVQNGFLSQATIKQGGLAGYIDWDVSDDTTIRSITSYREIDGDNTGDFDFGPQPVADRLLDLQDFKTFSQEFLIQHDTNVGGMDVELVGGLHYFDESIDYIRKARWTGLPLSTPFVDFQDLLFEQEEKAIGIFGHATIALTDSLELVGGVRWNEVDKDLTYTSNLGTPEAYHDFAATNFFLAYAVLGGGTLQTAFDYDNETTNEEVNYDIALQWRPTDNLQLFASFARGFKAGGFNLTEAGVDGNPAAAGGLNIGGRVYNDLDLQSGIVDPEFVDTFEVGGRYQLENGIISATLFSTQFEDLQLSVFTGTQFETLNSVGEIESQGLELDGVYNLTDELTINGAITFLDASYGDEVQAFIPAGRELVQSPDVSFTVGANYDRPLTQNLDMFVNASYAFTGEHFSAEDGCTSPTTGLVSGFDDCAFDTVISNRLANEEQDSYGLLNLTLGLRSADDWTASIFCNNCTDEEYYSWRFNQPLVSGNILGNPGSPSTYGVKIQKDF